MSVMRHIKASLTAVLAVGLTSCATVDMAPERNPLNQSSYTLQSPLEIQNRTLVKTSARRLTSVFSKEGWSAIAEDGVQSAASVLLWGKRKAQDITDPVARYLERRSERREVVEDMEQARRLVIDADIAAQDLLRDNPEATELRSELGALEDALLSARQAEHMFEKAMVKLGIEADHKSYREFVESVDNLKLTTDLYGQRVRGKSGGAES